MNIFIAFMLILSAVGLCDKILGGKRGLGAEFDHGIHTMGGMALSLVGIYCLGITLVQKQADSVAKLSAILPFDPSLIIGSLLAPDLGGYTIAMNMASNRLVGLFSGLLVAATLGCTISFVLPVSMAAIKKEDASAMMNGLILGIVTIPASLIVGGLLLGLPLKDFLSNGLPILLICVLLYLLLTKAPKMTTKILMGFANVIQFLCFSFFGVVMAGLFIPSWQIASYDLVCESLVVVAKITVVVCGAMVLSHIALTRFLRPIRWVARHLKINDSSAVGLLLSLATSVSMLPLFDRMDHRGKVMNAAFSVSGAFVLGGQLAFVSSLETSQVVRIYMISKLCGGICAVIAAMLTAPADPDVV